MTEWVQYRLVKDENQRLRDRVAELEDEIEHLSDRCSELEAETLDLMADLAEARFDAQSRHPSTRRGGDG